MSNNLYYELVRAHDIAAVANPNGSLVVAHVTYLASGNLTQALAAAALAQGDLHAPIEAVRDMFHSYDRMLYAASILEEGGKVPGFGNSFYKDLADPAFAEVEAVLRADHASLVGWVDELRSVHPKLPPPNAAMWTALAMEAMGMERGMGPALFISARVKAWASYLLALKPS